MKKEEGLKPVTKWVGGKRKLLPVLKDIVPTSFNNYYEPFVGGGALLFSLQPKNAIINDANKELIEMYKTIRDSPTAIINNLRKHEMNNSKEYFLNIRELDRKKCFSELSDIDRAARLLYMLRVDFNGLYRVNKKGQFNVPYGKYKNPKIVDEKNIYAVSNYFKNNNIKFYCGDFFKSIENVDRDDLVYFDPPYIPLTATSDFTSYTAEGFTMDDQKRLRDTFFELSKRGAYVILSNSDTQYTRELFYGANIHEIKVGRSINSNGEKRGKVGEVIVTNF